MAIHGDQDTVQRIPALLYSLNNPLAIDQGVVIIQYAL